jgi:hypothetical protein
MLLPLFAWGTSCQPPPTCPPGDGVGAWVSATTAGLPGQRHGHVIATLSGQFVVWGGVGPDGAVLGDGARWNPADNAWSALPAEGAPGARVEAAFAAGLVQGTRNVLVVLGGHRGTVDGPQDGANVLADGALLEAQSWTWKTLPAGPPARYRAAMALDPASGRAFVSGGLGADGVPLQDTWQLDLTVDPPLWTAVPGVLPLATPRSPGALAAEPVTLAVRPQPGALGQLVAVSGAGVGGPVARAATFDLPMGPWVLDDAFSAPPARVGASATWALNLGAMVVHGGVRLGQEPGAAGSAYLKDLAVYLPRVKDPSRPQDPTASLPGTNTWRSACGDVDAGVPAAAAQNDCGLLDVSVPRAFHAAVWLGDGLLVVGGLDPLQCGGAAVWNLLDRRWTRVSFGGSPYRGRQPGLAWLEGRGAFSFGQHRPAALSDQPPQGSMWVP